MKDFAVQREFKVDKLSVKIYESRAEMGAAAASAAAGELRRLLEKQPDVRMIFAAAPSQNEFLEALVKSPGIAWERITAFHMDEYLGLPAGAPQSFGEYLRTRIFGKVPFKEVFYLQPDTPDIKKECDRYAGLLEEAPIDMVCMGIGENGHVAFNDPPVADFEDPLLVKVVELDMACRQQQVHDGCFSRLEDVPRQAITLTVPALMSGGQLHVMVPGPTKTKAVTAALTGPIDTYCPASILRTHPNSVLYLDKESGRGI
ncbi:MAG: glucosamine-6-phosphate deaminase [Calditrichia bacterium]